MQKGKFHSHDQMPLKFAFEISGWLDHFLEFLLNCVAAMSFYANKMYGFKTNVTYVFLSTL